MATLVDLTRVSVSRPDRALFVDLSLTVSSGDRLGVVGINGTGKTTLLRVLAGTLEPDSGQVRRGRGTRVGFVEQDPVLPAGSVRRAVGAGWEAEAMLDRLGLGAVLDAATSELSGGQAKRVALARTLVHPAELLVLDEPTNHLDLGAVAWLESWLAAFSGGVVMVTHDRHLLDRVTTRMVELDRGKPYVHEGGYSAYLEAKIVREEQAASAEATRRNLARRELAWLRRGAPARSRKPQARIDAAIKVVEGRAEAPARAEDLDLAFGTPRLGSKVIEMADASFRYRPDRPDVLRSVSLALDPRERLGVVGGNGEGKSTLLELMAGRQQPTGGTVERGPTVRLGYYDQRTVTLDPDARVRDLVAGPTRVPGAPEDLRLMDRFWFSGELQWATVKTLSGGERRRLQLLLVLAERPNVLLLDEPTNDLDLDTLRTLEDLLDDWPGALVVVSHDRTFLERTTDRLLACTGGTVSPVPGGVAAWVQSVLSGPTRSRPAARATPVPGPAPSPSPRRKSAPSVNNRLRELEKRMTQLTKKRDSLTEELAAAGDHKEMARIGALVAEVQGELDGVEARWLEIAEEAEGRR